jgi:hypothetical protein
MRILVGVILVFLVALSQAAPSDLIQIGPRPVAIGLSGATPSSAKAIDALNEPLGMFKSTNLPNVGHYASWVAYVDQDLDAPVGVPMKLLNFSEMTPDIPVSVGNTSTNITVINSTAAGGLVYL